MSQQTEQTPIEFIIQWGFEMISNLLIVFYKLCTILVRFKIEVIIGYKINIATAFSTAAGSTIVPNSTVNEPGSPTNKEAEPKNTVPETIVPMAVKMIKVGSFFDNLLVINSKPKNTKDVTTLSIIFGNNPLGKLEVNPEMIPVTTPKITTYLTSLNNIIPRNIIVSIISGFIPKTIPGMTIESTAPTPTSKAKLTSDRVFICLNSPILFYTCFPTVSS